MPEIRMRSGATFMACLTVLFCAGCASTGEYTLTVNQGAGGGTFEEGAVVVVTADDPSAGEVFDRWIGDVDVVESPNAPATTFTMPATDVTLTATYRPASAPTFDLTVNGGSGDGTYLEGALVDVAAAAPPSGQVFDRWTGDIAGLASATDASTTFVMPGADASLAATYRTVVVNQSFQRHVIELTNATYTGNPFELEVDATFTHEGGASLTLPGYYAGDDTWKVAFLPTRTGVWTWTTASADADLDGASGSVEFQSLGHQGVLKGDPDHPRKWKYDDGGYVVPIALRCDFFMEPASASEFTAAADFLKANEIQMLETRLLEEYGMFGGRHDFIFAGDWRDHEFDLSVWDRMEERMNILAERGVGAHVMFYSDDQGEPGWGGRSATEALVIRYVVARLASYPAVVWNTGIDISEYRSGSDIDWFGQRIRALDAYGHPVSSRRGGGSGGHQMSGQTFDSRGDRRAEIDVMLSHFAAATVPVSMDDAWGENRGSHADKDHTPADIRRALWKCVASGGVGALLRGGGDGLSQTGFYSIKRMQSDLESEQWLRHVNPFVRDELGDHFGEMVPVASLVSGLGAYALADPDRDRIFVFLMGDGDTYDNGSGLAATVALAGLTGTFDAWWFDPRSGVKTSIGGLAGGLPHILTPSNGDDWVIVLKRR